MQEWSSVDSWRHGPGLGLVVGVVSVMGKGS